MCLIVDVNVAEDVLIKNDDIDFSHVHKALFATKSPPAKLVYGGKLFEEYKKNLNVLKALQVLNQAGRTRTVSSEKNRF